MKDFSPYVAKIKASGADSVLTGNWGSDLALFVKATRENGLKAVCSRRTRGESGHRRRWARQAKE